MTVSQGPEPPAAGAPDPAARPGPAEPRLLACGDSAISVDFGDHIDPGLNARVVALDAALCDLALPGVLETVPTYRSLLVHVDATMVDFPALCDTLRRLARRTHAQTMSRRRWRVPVVYGGAFGVDLAALATDRGMRPADFVQAHVQSLYTVYMIGFMPGFAYLGGLDPRLATPRRREPRSSVPDRSISIGGAQSAIGSLAAPSGWQLIGRTPVRACMPGRSPVFLFEPGDEVVFEPLSEDAWPALDAAASAGEIVATLEEP